MTDDEFKARFIAALTAQIVDEWEWPQPDARAHAESYCDDVPRHELLEQYQDDPEFCAREAFEELRAYGSDDGDDDEVLANG